MSAKVEQIIDKDGVNVYPVTRSSAVYMPNGFTSLDETLADMQEGNSKIEFLNDGSIKKTMASGSVVKTSFLSDGSIQDVCTDKKGREVYTKTTSFKDDGSIETSIDYKEND